MKNNLRIGILGPGKLGITLARLATKAGYLVMIASSGDPQKITLTVETLVPGAVAADSMTVARESDVIILALPLGKFRNLPKQALAGKLVIDAMNYWWEVDGSRDDFIDPALPSSVAVQQFLDKSRVVKALNHMGYHHLHDEARPAAEPGRKAIAVAGDNSADIETVTRLVDQLGFDPLYIGKLSESSILETGGPAFGLHVPKTELAEALNITHAIVNKRSWYE